MSRLLLRFRDARQARPASYPEVLVWAESATDSAWINPVESRSETLTFTEFARENQNVEFSSEHLTLTEVALAAWGQTPDHQSETLLFADSGFDASGLVLYEPAREDLGPFQESKTEAYDTVTTTEDATTEILVMGEERDSLIAAMPELFVETFLLAEGIVDIWNRNWTSAETEVISVLEVSPSPIGTWDFKAEAITLADGNANDVYTHTPLVLVENVIETIVLADETLNLLLIATGVTMIEVAWDLTGRWEASTETITINELGTSVMGRIAMEEDWGEILVATTAHASAARKAFDFTETVNAPDSTHRVALRHPGALAAETLTVTDGYLDDITHVPTNAWLDPMTEIILWSELHGATRAVFEEKLEYLPLESFPQGRLTERVFPRDQVEGSKS